MILEYRFLFGPVHEGGIGGKLDDKARGMFVLSPVGALKGHWYLH